MDVPENKMMLAVYLTATEIENDRRGLNTKAGIKQAKKEGRWTGLAPLGYINRTRVDGRKYITTKEPKAGLIKWVFTQLEKGVFSSEEILKSALEKGLKCSKNNFYHIIKNPMYCGKIIIPQYKEEEMQIIQGKHTALISEAQFHTVQELLLKKKKKGSNKNLSSRARPKRIFTMSKLFEKAYGKCSQGKQNAILNDLSRLFTKSNIEEKRELLSNIIKKNTYYDGDQFKSPSLNAITSEIYSEETK